MSYPQSGGYGYGQNPQGAQPYGQPADYGQQSPGQYEGQQYAGQQYGQPQGYDAQAQQAQAQQGQYAQQQYAQQYQQAQYGYSAPQQPANPGLPANTPIILAGIIGALGIITLFCGFLDGYSPESGSGDGVQLFQSHFVLTYGLVTLAGLLALTTFVVGATKHFVAGIASVAVTAGIITIFQFAMMDPMFKEGGSRGVGAIILLITAILSAIAAVAWLLVEGGQIKLADAVAAPAAPAPVAADASQYGGAHQAAAPAADYGYGYGQQAQAAAPQAQPGQYAQTQYGQSAQSQPGDQNATTAFGKPATDPGVNPQSEQH
ncbi:DUF5336 domain-containing protein [Gordonia liuliyuniae]|uniref:DUF5336 domain-containing protein n=1 Tax=Gordonia liuliyuniae TaxID=2911517 RepID=A0ABS9IW80_9ACTN|nr:DUF5336 domain-containing protein [Gordonia liuliyuniae]MCF8589808.1 DUF5336 domain-containing protein [Gordonia liuliyuniae]